MGDMEVAELKKLLKVPAADTSKDSFFEEVLEPLVELAGKICNDDFTDATVYPTLPGGIKLFVRDAVMYLDSNQGKKSETLDEYSYTIDTSEFPKAVLQWLKPYKKMRHF